MRSNRRLENLVCDYAVVAEQAPELGRNPSETDSSWGVAYFKCAAAASCAGGVAGATRQIGVLFDIIRRPIQPHSHLAPSIIVACECGNVQRISILYLKALI